VLRDSPAQASAGTIEADHRRVRKIRGE
jgi:hypothetical protein